MTTVIVQTASWVPASNQMTPARPDQLPLLCPSVDGDGSAVDVAPSDAAARTGSERSLW